MDDVVDDDNIDLEELQAQIDLTLANTQNLVASWIDPNYGPSTSKQTLANQEKEIEELLKRPPRLGVGASVPAATGSLGHSAVKLKGKLTGKKRPREEEDSIVISSQSDEEEESRAGAITKKPRIDPFAQGKGKKKAKAKATPTVLAAPGSTMPAGKDSEKAPVAKEKVPARPAVTEPVLSPRAKPSESSGGKKKKKKNKSATVPIIPNVLSPNLSLVSRSKSPEVVEVIVIKDTPPSTPERRKEDNRTYTATSLPKERAKTPERAKPLISSGQAALGLPLLNLDGPPPTIEHGSPSKRKRKRKKKKKFDQMHQTQATGGDDPMDVDADAKEDHLKHTTGSEQGD